MSLSIQTVQNYTAILREELIPAMGCTEPIAIAYAAAILGKTLGGHPSSIRLLLSGNIIKNVKSVIVPATGGMHGIKAAVAAGIIASCPERRLEVLEGITGADHPRIAAYCESLSMELLEMETEKPFDLDMSGTYNGITARVKITDRHTNVILVERNGEDLTSSYLCSEHHKTLAVDHTTLNVKEIVEFAETVPLDELEPLLSRQIELNMAIAEEGVRGDWGASIGKILLSHDPENVRVRARLCRSRLGCPHERL